MQKVPVLRSIKRAMRQARQVAKGSGQRRLGYVSYFALVNVLRTVADPDADEAHIESVTADAPEQVAAASARASRAEQAQRKAEKGRAESYAGTNQALMLRPQLVLSIMVLPAWVWAMVSISVFLSRWRVL